MTFYNNFKAICEKLNIKPTPLIIECGGSKGMYTTWKNGAIPKIDIVIALANRLGVSTDYLLLGKRPTIPPEYKSLIGAYDQLSDYNKRLLQEIISSMVNIQEADEKRSKIKFITIKHSIYKVSAGIGYDLDEGDNWEEIDIPETPESLRADFAVTVDGDSMEPDFSAGDIVLIKQQPTVDIGQIGIFTIEDKGYIKKYGGDRLISLNDKYEDILFSKYDSEEIRCNGLVLGIADVE